MRHLLLGPLTIEQPGQGKTGHVGVAGRRLGTVFVALVELPTYIVDVGVIFQVADRQDRQDRGLK